MKLSRSLAQPLASSLKLKLPSVAAGVSLSAEVAAYIAAMSSAPDATRQGHIATLIDGLVADGVWAKLDWLSLLASHDAQAARLNAKNTAQSFSVVSSPTFTTDRGYRGAASSYLNSGWDPATNGVNFTQNSAFIGAWSLTNDSAATAAMGNLGSFFYPQAGSVRINQLSTFSAGSITDSSGLLAADRSEAPVAKLYKNAVEIGSNIITTASSALSSLDFYALGWNNSGSITGLDTTRTYAAMVWGASLDATEQAAVHSRLSTYLTAVGAI